MKAQRKLLLVDDEEAIVFAMGEYFEARGYGVDRARDAEGARELLLCGGYSVVILDLRLGADGDSDGLALAGEIRERFPRTRTMILTAYGSPDVEQRARRMGIDAFLHKPQHLQHVAEIVDRLAAPA